jgi:hypothetical protein
VTIADGECLQPSAKREPMKRPRARGALRASVDNEPGRAENLRKQVANLVQRV